MERSQRFYFSHCQRCNNNGCLYNTDFPCKHCGAYMDDIDTADNIYNCACISAPTDDEIRTNSCKYFVLKPKKEEQ